jgi:hypothetical protein
MQDVTGAGVLREWFVDWTAQVLVLLAVTSMIFGGGTSARRMALSFTSRRRRLPITLAHGDRFVGRLRDAL